MESPPAPHLRHYGCACGGWRRACRECPSAGWGASGLHDVSCCGECVALPPLYTPPPRARGGAPSGTLISVHVRLQRGVREVLTTCDLHRQQQRAACNQRVSGWVGACVRRGCPDGGQDSQGHVPCVAFTRSRCRRTSSRAPGHRGSSPWLPVHDIAWHVSQATAGGHEAHERVPHMNCSKTTPKGAVMPARSTARHHGIQALHLSRNRVRGDGFLRRGKACHRST